MLDDLRVLAGKEVNLFDKTGGCLDINGNYIRDWMDQSNTVKLVCVIAPKFIVLEDSHGIRNKIKVTKVQSIEGSDLTLS